jgi:hypothetical protein
LQRADRITQAVDLVVGEGPTFLSRDYRDANLNCDTVQRGRWCKADLLLHLPPSLASGLAHGSVAFRQVTDFAIYG